MKKLSVNRESEIRRYIVSREINSRIIAEGFSGFEDKDGRIFAGYSTACEGRYCSVYTDGDISPERFKTFVKNPSKRVCPVSAIRFNGGRAVIDSEVCISCGLCVHRCPYAAISMSLEKSQCMVNHTLDEDYYKIADAEMQKEQIAYLREIEERICFHRIPVDFCSTYQNDIRRTVKSYPDISEIIVRNTFINLGWQCATKPAGNNHIRTEFFAQKGDCLVVGESEITNSDTLSVARRILDDLSVLIGRYDLHKAELVPLAVINGLPNRRTDYYEVITDIQNILGVRISTLTYYLLFVIQLFHIPITGNDIRGFYVDKYNQSLIEPMNIYLDNIRDIDENTLHGNSYHPYK